MLIHYQDVEIVNEGNVRVRIRKQLDFKPSHHLGGPYAVDGAVEGTILLDGRGLSEAGAREAALKFLLMYVSGRQMREGALRFEFKPTKETSRTSH